MPVCNCCGAATQRRLFKSHIYTLLQCSTCNLHFVDPMPDSAARMEDVHSGRYGDDLQVLGADGQYSAEQAREPILSGYIELAKKYRSEGRMLDVGCGAGYLMVLAQRAGYKTDGVELTADRHAKAVSTTGSMIYDQPIEDLDLPAETYDVITMINVFSHLANPLRTLKRVAQLLRPGGVIILATGEITGAPVRHEHLPEWTLGDELFFLGENTIDRFAESMGVDVAGAHRTWLPDALYSRDQFKIMGRSAKRNAIKRAFLATPGAITLLHYVMTRRQADNPIHNAVFVLRKPATQS